MRVHIAESFEDIRDVEELAGSETWAHARRFLDALPDDPFADHLRWMEEDGRPVACVQVFLHKYAIGRAKVGVCLPEYPFVAPELRGRGHFRAMMSDLFEWMRANGYPLAYSHGRKGLYTGIGYAPCFHHGTVLMRVRDALSISAPCVAEQAAEEDVAAHENLFRRPVPLGRGLQCRDETWRPDPDQLMVVRAGESGDVVAFAVAGQVTVRRPPGEGASALTEPAAPDGVVTVTDCWADHASAAAALLRGLADNAGDIGAGWLRLSVRRDDPIARIAVLAGGEHRWSAAQERNWSGEEDVDAFYLADLPTALRQMLPELNARWHRFGRASLTVLSLQMGEEPEVALELGPDLRIGERVPGDAACVRMGRKAMTRALLGYATLSELALLHADCDIPACCREVMDALFPVREPHIIHENLAFARPEQFGLVP